jgi:hypothetical protein
MKHIYLKWKRKLQAKVIQCSSSIRTSALLFKKVFRSIRLAIWTNKTGTAVSACFLCPKLALCALNPHFSGRTSRICLKTIQAQSILWAFSFHVACILRFLDVLRRFFCESLHKLLFPLFLCPGDVHCSFFRAFLTGVSVKVAVVLFFLFTFWLFLGLYLGRGQMSSGEEGCVSSFEVDLDGPGELIDVSGFHCYCWKLL